MREYRDLLLLKGEYFIGHNKYRIYLSTRLVEQGTEQNLAIVLSRLRKWYARAEKLTCQYIRLDYNPSTLRGNIREMFFRDFGEYDNWSKRVGIWMITPKTFKDIDNFCTEMLTKQMEQLRKHKAHKYNYE